jgi:carboxylesterase type B
MPDATVPELWLAISTDGVFRIPAIRLAEAQSAHAPVWLYRFAFESPVFGGILKSTHALEIPFVFDTLDQRGADKFAGKGPELDAISDAMHRAWIAFAREGDPGWPAYEAPRRATMRFGRPDAPPAELVDDPDGNLRRAWDVAAG